MTAYTHKLPSGSFTDLLRAAAAYREAPGRSVPADAPPSPQTVPERTDVGGSVAELTRLAAMSSGVESSDMPDGGIEEHSAGGCKEPEEHRDASGADAFCNPCKGGNSWFWRFIGLAAAVAGAWALNGVFRRWSVEAGERCPQGDEGKGWDKQTRKERQCSR